jgi:[ribosomal protein S18]-alanine N-acetyltransferase
MSVVERLLRRETRVTRDAPDRAGGLVISRMRRRDLRAGVMAIESVSYPRPWSHSVFESEIDQMNSGARHYVVAHRGRSIVGYAGLWFTADEAHVTNVAVHPRGQRTGVATRLLVVLGHEAIRRRCTAWTLEVRVTSTGAQELYRKFGFAPAGVRKRYYENTEDAIVMWCNEIQSPGYAALLDSLESAAITGGGTS